MELPSLSVTSPTHAYSYYLLHMHADNVCYIYSVCIYGTELQYNQICVLDLDQPRLGLCYNTVCVSMYYT
jgi:hypothetical protein